MRPLKFRAWDTENKCWYKPIYEAYNRKLFALLLSFSGDLVANTITGLIHESCWPNRYIVSQFTGLEDKSGKEIYEGDIVHSFRSGNRGNVFWHDDRAMFMVDDSITDKFIEPNDDWNDYEVIGNIYENP